MVDLFMFLIVAGTGDELQGIKRGIMEMCDIVVFTKDDGDNKLRTSTAKRQMQSALQLLPPKNSGWMPKVTSVSSLEFTGFDELNTIIDDYFKFILKNNFLAKNRNQQAVDWFFEQIVNLLKNSFFTNEQISKLIPILTNQIKNNEISPISAARQLVDLFSNNLK
jgi:LAO/AO transport system kinase